MRGELSGLAAVHSIGERLPAVYAEDEFAQRWTAALDQVLAPVLTTLDCLYAYFDPRLAPDDFLDWLAGWVAFGLDEGWSGAQRRELVEHAVELHRWRGTRRGVAAHVELLTGGEVEVLDNGACTLSERSGSPLPEGEPPQVTVRVRVDAPATVDQQRLRAAVAAAVPAHVHVTVEVLPTEGGTR
jgi:phage tail-like protein